MKNVKNALVAIALALPMGAMCAEPYVLDSNKEVVMSGSGTCVRTGYWSPALAAQSKFVLKCDKELAPKPKVVPRPKVTIKEEVTGVFAFDSATLTPKVKAMLATLGNSSNDLVEVYIEGYTDPIGKDSYNHRLAKKRANAVKDYLVSLGVPKEIITAVGIGSVGQCCELESADCYKVKPLKKRIECNEPNRKVVIRIKYLANC